MSLPPEDLSTVEDFLENDAFRAWVVDRREEDRLYWQKWLAEHPEKSELYEQAVVVLVALGGKTEILSDRQVKEKTRQILNRLPDAYSVTRPLFSWRWATAAAAAVIILAIGWQRTRYPDVQLSAGNTRNPKEVQHNSWKLVKNFTSEPLVVLLPDNSSVLLSKNSELRFRKRSTPNVREVYLRGEGFFEVTKDPAKPFIVYTTNLATKVFGTSFQIRSFDTEAADFVKVKTGKVTVAPIKAPEKAVFLTVNQSAKLESATRKITKFKSYSADKGSSPIITEPFTFDYAPLPEVFDKLMSSYHMPIQYDRAVLKNCTFTGQLDDLPYLEKLRLICLSIESTFEIVDNRVTIHSQGCK